MELNQKINFQKYLLLTIGNLLTGYAFSSENWQYLGIVVLFSAANQILLIKILDMVLNNNKESKNKFKLIAYFILKSTLLGSAFYILVLYARDQVLLGVILYIFQLIILVLSIKNIASLFNKKGPKV
jgi:hypothetical protein